MPNHRDHGYSLLHKGCLLFLSFAWFWLCVALGESWFIPNKPSLELRLPVAIAGLLVGTLGTFKNYGAFFMKNGWQRIRDSLPNQTLVAVIIFFVIGAYFATKDK